MTHYSPTAGRNRVECDECTWRGLSGWSDKKSKAELVKHMNDEHGHSL